MRRLLPRAVVWSLFFLAFADANAADELLVAPDDAPQYRLSNFRLQDGRFGRPIMIFDYERTRAGKGHVQLAARTADGPIRITFSPDVSDARGEVALEKMGVSRGGSYDYEFYFVVPARWAGEYYGNCVVSNSVTMGNPGRGPTPRAWTDEERAAYEKNKLANKTPDSAPSGYEVVGPGVTLPSGMPVKASRYAEWVNAEVLTAAPGGKVSVLYEGDTTATTIDRDGWLAAEPSVLSDAQQHPDRFKPSMRVLPGGRYPLPRDAQAIAPDLELPRGMPLLLERGNRWEDVVVLSDMGPKVEVRYADNMNFDFPHERTSLAIRAETLEQLRRPGAAEKFAKDLDETADAQNEMLDDDEVIVGSSEAFGKRRGKKMHIFDKDYKIKSTIPRGAKIVPEDVELPEGTPLAYNWARSWEKCLVVADLGPDVLVLEADHGVFVWRIARDQLIVQTKTLRRLPRSSDSAKPADLQKTLRTWTDASGQHKVEARFVRRSEDKVTLQTDTGREISLPIAKLCEEDQELLKDVKPAAAVANPFE